MMKLDDIAAQIIDDLDLDERVRMANLPASEIEIVEKVLARYRIERLQNANLYSVDASGKAKENVEKVWERLREMHRLRVVAQRR
jgi:ribosomal protein S13